MILSFSIAVLCGAAVFLISAVGMHNESSAKPGVNTTIESRRQLISFTDQNSGTKGSQDSRPLISPNGKELFFCRRNHPDNIGGEKDFQDVWVTTVDENGNWTETHNLGNAINDKMANGICSISPDGNEIYIFNNSGNKNAPISRSKKINGAWSNPEEIIIDGFSNKSDFTDFSYSFEHNVLFMAVERANGYGNQDIWYSMKGTDGHFTKPENLGFMINTYTAEFAPYLSEDGKYLYFSSYRPGGLGKSDIYVSTRLDETWKNWSPPKNLGSEVNTKNEESYFSLTSDLENIYLESYSENNTERNIYKVKLSNKN